jgi:hypothetical protein
MKKVPLEAVAALIVAGAAAPVCLAAPGPLLPAAVEVLEERERGQLWRVAAAGEAEWWWKRYVVPTWKWPLSLLQRSRSRREACGLELLRQRDLPAPRVCACLEWRPHRTLHESALITESIPGAVALTAFLRSEPDAARRAVACEAAGTLAAQLHEAGVGHFRMLAKNVLITPADPARAWILDAPYLCAWDTPVPAPVRRFDLASLCSRAGELDLVQSGHVLAAYARATGIHWDERRLAGAPRWRLRMRRVSLYLLAIWSGHRCDRFITPPTASA